VRSAPPLRNMRGKDGQDKADLRDRDRSGRCCGHCRVQLKQHYYGEGHEYACACGDADLHPHAHGPAHYAVAQSYAHRPANLAVAQPHAHRPADAQSHAHRPADAQSHAHRPAIYVVLALSHEGPGIPPVPRPATTAASD
jgi:hypothetical protein